jgi:hypothetical protein
MNNLAVSIRPRPIKYLSVPSSYTLYCNLHIYVFSILCSETNVFFYPLKRKIFFTFHHFLITVFEYFVFFVIFVNNGTLAPHFFLRCPILKIFLFFTVMFFFFEQIT